MDEDEPGMADAQMDPLGNITILTTGQILKAEDIEHLWFDLNPESQALILPIMDRPGRYLYVTRKKPDVN